MKRIQIAMNSSLLLPTGKPWGNLCRSVELARRSRELGCRIFSIYGELDSFKAGLSATQEKFADVLK